MSAKTDSNPTNQDINIDEVIGLRHLGIIADGNRRWAKEQGLPTIEGHKKGLSVIEELVMAAAKAGIEYISFYVFSTENWGRSKAEVSYIMKLAETRIAKYAEKLAANNAKLLVLGSKERLSHSMLEALAKAEKTTEHCTGITVCFCFNYGGEQEIADAANAAVRNSVEQTIAATNLGSGPIDAGIDGELDDVIPLSSAITPADIRQHLYHPEVPDLDMIVRTSGEERLSGFMLWRAAYAELMFVDKYFPEMQAADIDAILAEYQKRHRRFGK